MTKWTIAIVLTLTLAACGGGGDDPAAGECRALVDRICDRFAECNFMGTTSSAECHDQADQSFDCGDADQTGATYQDCMDTMQSITCPDLNMLTSLPPECIGVILYE